MKALVIFAVCVGMVVGQVVEIHNDQDNTSHQDCHSLYKSGYTKNGTYKLTLNGEEFLAPCEFRAGNGFTIFLNRMDHTIRWDRTYREYVSGFGAPFHDYFSGLERLHSLTQLGNTNLEVYMEDWDGEIQYTDVNHFSVGDSRSYYKLTISEASHGTVKNDLYYSNGRQFYTIDRPDPSGCVHDMRGGWWYKYCSRALPTGHYYENGEYCTKKKFADGIFWTTFRGIHYSLKRLVMAVRRQS